MTELKSVSYTGKLLTEADKNPLEPDSTKSICPLESVEALSLNNIPHLNLSEPESCPSNSYLLFIPLPLFAPANLSSIVFGLVVNFGHLVFIY